MYLHGVRARVGDHKIVRLRQHAAVSPCYSAAE